MAQDPEITLQHKHLTQIWIAILIFSVITRLGLALHYGNWVPTEHDDYSYSSLGLRLATGHGYTFDRNWYPFTPAETPTAHWSFLYTVIIAAIYALVGFQPVAVRLVTAVLGGILLPWMTARLTRHLFPNRSWLPLIAALITAGYAFFILYAAQIMTETFYIITLLWSFERALKLSEDFAAGQSGWSAALGLGVSLGLTALFRQAVLPWVPVLFLWLLWRAWHANARIFIRLHLPSLVLAGLVLLAFILPWTYRNYRVYGDFLLLNSNTGYAMYSAQHPMHGTSFQAFEAAPLPGELWGQLSTEAEWDSALLRRGIAFVLADPVRYLRLSLSRVADYFEFWPTDTSLLNNAGRLLSFTLYLPFMLYGFYLGAKVHYAPVLSCLARPTTLLFLFMVFYSLLHIFTWAMPRYRLPVDAVAMPFVALALERIFFFVRGWARRRHAS
ncbi:MAG: glycosyltransferase family 39 protein [Anaerolineae bacterium]|nr:glycosyltransferase family 39 protein [Anaerolineae bacterium]